MSQSKSSEHRFPRLQKVLATAGFGSRRNCETLISEGRVEIDRDVVTELGTRVDPDTQQIRVDGVVVKLPRHKYFLLHKPVGVVSTARDPWARTRVIDLVDDPDRLFTVGRLDKSSSGLILVTNDGDLANQLAHPRFGIRKTYRVTVVGRPTGETLKKLRHGLYLAEGRARVEQVAVKSSRGKQSQLEIVLAEGRNREIRRLLARVGHKVLQLKRVGMGPLRLADLPVGAYRELTRQEVIALRNAIAGVAPPGSRRRGGGRAKQSRDSDSPSGGGRRSSKSGGKPSTAGKRTGRRPVAAVGRGQARPASRTRGTVLGEEATSAERRPAAPGRKAGKQRRRGPSATGKRNHE